MARIDTATATVNELCEFASFSSGEQRYIKRSLDVGLGRQDAVRLWARDEREAAAIRAQYAAYRDLPALRAGKPCAAEIESVSTYVGHLLRVTVFDLAQERLDSFSAYRFLYERLLGADARPWLPAAFCGAAALPQLRPQRRKALLQSISEAVATAPAWSMREPCFYPEWVEAEAA